MESRLYGFELEYYIDKERAGEKGTVMDIQVKEFNGRRYKIYNGTWYCFDTPDRVVQILDSAMNKHERIRVFYGNNETGCDWCEFFDTIGYVDRSYGNVKIPLLIKNSRSIGGPGILDGSIVKITIDKVVVYQHPNYYIDESKFDDLTEKQIAFLKGERNREF